MCFEIAGNVMSNGLRQHDHRHGTASESLAGNSFSGSYVLASCHYEGPAVSYGTPYRVQADLHSRTGALLASSGMDVISSPQL